MIRKRWWRIVLPFVILAKVAVIVILISSSAPDEKTVIIKPDVTYEPVKVPDRVLFAGEEIPVNRFDVYESLDRELLSNAYFHSQTIRFIKLAPRYFSVIEPVLRENGIPDDFKYLALAESGLNPRAVSPAQAVGLWQFLRTTALEYGLEVSKEVDERYHVKKSTTAACNYLNDAFKKYGKWSLVAASYNGGMTGINRQMERQKTDNYYDLLLVEETSRYLYRIVALKLILENPAEFGFNVPEDQKYPLIPVKHVEISGPVPDFADFARSNGISYKRLKDFNPWLRENFLSNTAGRKYTVEIPVLHE